MRRLQPCEGADVTELPRSCQLDATRAWRQGNSAKVMLKSPARMLGTAPAPSASTRADLARAPVSNFPSKEPVASPYRLYKQISMTQSAAKADLCTSGAGTPQFW